MADEIRVLLVEDNPGDARLIREMLIDAHLERIGIDHVMTLADAFAQLQQHTYDAVLLDLSLPDSFGIDTLLRLEARAKDSAIVVFTGLHDEQLGVEAVQRGAQDYLSKGDVDSRLLVRAIRYAIERHRTEAALRRSEQEYRSLINDVFDTSMVAVLILDQQLRVVWCNEATEIYFGIQREHMLGRDKRQLIDMDLKCIFADPDDYAAQLSKAYSEGSFTDRFECQVVAEGNRTERWLEHWSQPIREGVYQGGRIEQYTDITDRKKLEFAEREQREFAEALREISTLLTSSLDLDEVLARILNNLEQVVPHDTATITLLADDHITIARRRRVDGHRTYEMVTEDHLPIEHNLFVKQMLDTRAPVIVPDLQVHPEFQMAAPGADVHAYVVAPILLQDDTMGYISVMRAEVDFFAQNHAERLTAFSRLAAIALQNARLFEQSHRLATLEERQRLARELHDSVSQTLFTCRTMSETVLRRWNKDPKSAYRLSQDVNQLITTALVEMRILLLELRPNALTQISLKQLFEQYLQPIQKRRQFDLALQIDEIGPLPANVQLALYRITQEALNNIDKHAQASFVEIHATDDVDKVTLVIRDNGQGFSVESVTPTSLGLEIMRERAEEIGALLEVASKTHEGTQIKVIWQKEK